MTIPWPTNTTFKILIEGTIEIWKVSDQFNRKEGIINKESALGNSLIFSEDNKYWKYKTPKGVLINYEILSIRLPGETDEFLGMPLDFYYSNFNEDPQGIRHSPFMANICIECGHENEPVPQGTRTCEACGNSWIWNHCWSCKSLVDSRDPKTPICSKKCGGCHCANCGHCFCDANFLWTHDDEEY